MPSDDIAQFLANSPERLALLASLSQGSTSPSELGTEHEASRRSIQRNLAEFVEREWVESDGGTYSLTVTGELVAEKHGAYIETLDLIDEFALFFRYLPDIEHAPETAWLNDSTITVATEEDPQAPVHRYVTSVKQLETDRIQMLSPVLSRLFHEAHAKLALRKVHTELIMPAPMVGEARERNALEFEAIIRLDLFELYSLPGGFNVGLTLGDDELLMAAYDDVGQLRALVESREPEFYAWASDLFEQYRENAELVTS
ncbi:helix-turn-helix transcriptional regulator [Halobaculum rarum]|uniref:helix-turn-helix transcriptional regulator n=1 Tax=Halobaculum rarum TaxID=3075122 RepID=UPI0032AFA3DA